MYFINVKFALENTIAMSKQSILLKANYTVKHVTIINLKYVFNAIN